MSIKKAIMAAVKANEARVNINEIAHLYRWTKSAIGEDVDEMEISFKYICGVKGGWNKAIKSRDYEGIIKEIEAATTEYFSMCAEQMNRNLRAGYR